MEFAIALIVFFYVVAAIFIWLWNIFLRDFFIALLPPSDDPKATEMEDLFRAYDSAFRRKKRK